MMNIENPRLITNNHSIYGDIRTMNFLEKRIARNNPQTIRQFCTSGQFHVDSKSVNFGSTLLHSAVKYKKHDIVILLLNILNASTDIKDNNGRTAFFEACERGHFYIVKIFTTHRINISTFLDKFDSQGMTPLLIAYQNNHYPICKWLISKGANYGHVAFNGYHILREDLETRFRDQVDLQMYLRNQTPYTGPIRRVRRRIGFTPYTDNTHASNSEIRSDNNSTSTPEFIVRGTGIVSTPIINAEISTTPMINPEIIEIIKEVPTFLANECIEMMIELKKTCQICFEPYQKDKVVIMKKCGHAVCLTCFSKLDKCHMCRISF
jgi:hypothetical protein